jgi:hypothetical protein
MDSTHITLRLPEQLAKAVARWARLHDQPRSQVVREAVAQYLGGKPTSAGPPSISARELGVRWPDLPRLTSEEVDSLSADIAAGRAMLPAVRTSWE